MIRGARLHGARRASARLLGVGSIAMLLAGCSSLLEGDCVSLGRRGVTVDVVDARTGRAPVTATLLLIERASPDSVERYTAAPSASTGRLVLSGASERTGIYTMIVSSPGYATGFGRT